MRGRSAFYILRPLLLAAVALLRLMPRSLVGALYGLSSHFTGVIGVGLRWIIAKRLAAQIGDNVLIGPRIEIRGWNALRIGNNVSIHNASFIDARGGLTIGNDVSIAHHCSVVTFDHEWSDMTKPIRDNPVRYQRVAIANDVWIGAGVRVLAGASIGTRSIVAAGAVVTRAVPEYSIAGGVPAKVIGSTREQR
jgi:acetyltransferase-like isoleucine patch superfamily enzyme